MTAPATARQARTVTELTVETSPLDEVRQLIPCADARTPLLWLREGEGIVGVGETLRLEFTGPNRIREAAEVWRATAQAAAVNDAVRMPGTGLVAFGTFAFDDESTATSTLIVPETVFGQRGDHRWITHIRPVTPATTTDNDRGIATAFEFPRHSPLGDGYPLSLLPGEFSKEDYRAAVATAVARIRAHGLSKVVLARDIRGCLPPEFDLRHALAELARGYPECWTFAVDGLIGSSPETLVRVHHGTVTARVLAGTASRGTDAVSDHAAAAALASSAKDQEEHRFAVTSVLEALRPHSADLDASALPSTLKLPNLWHLSTDVAGTLSDGASSLDLAGAVHPTAAVAGTPTLDALALIRELEPFDRGRYAAPVGWVGSDGDGEWAIALRCAQTDPRGDVTAYAGAGIVADSDPDQELAETTIKFRPIVEAFC